MNENTQKDITHYGKALKDIENTKTYQKAQKHMKTHQKVCKDISDIITCLNDIETNENTQNEKISLYRALDNTLFIRNTLNSIKITEEYHNIIKSIRSTCDTFKSDETPPLHIEDIRKALNIIHRHIITRKNTEISKSFENI